MDGTELDMKYLHTIFLIYIFGIVSTLTEKAEKPSADNLSEFSVRDVVFPKPSISNFALFLILYLTSTENRIYAVIG